MDFIKVIAVPGVLLGSLALTTISAFSSEASCVIGMVAVIVVYAIVDKI